MTDQPTASAHKVLQGYIWHPRDLTLSLDDHLPRTLEPNLHLLWDPMPAAPFTFFEDGTLSATQQFYQFTVLSLDEIETAARLVPWLAETLQTKLNATPPAVGWHIFEDLREV